MSQKSTTSAFLPLVHLSIATLCKTDISKPRTSPGLVLHHLVSAPIGESILLQISSLQPRPSFYCYWVRPISAIASLTKIPAANMTEPESFDEDLFADLYVFTDPFDLALDSTCLFRNPQPLLVQTSCAHFVTIPPDTQYPNAHAGTLMMMIPLKLHNLHLK